MKVWSETKVVSTLLLAILWSVGCAVVPEPLPTLALTPNALSVSAKVGTSSSQIVTVTNIGKTKVGVSQAIINGTGFSAPDLATPLSLAPQQSKSFTVKFAAANSGTVNGTLMMRTDAQHRPVVLSLHGTAGTTTPNVASVAVTPTTASPAPSAKVQFTAAVQGATTNDSVTWTASMGAITSSGVYTAPATAATATVTATSVADPTKSASAVVTVGASGLGSAVSSVSVSPPSAASITGGTVPFKAVVQGTTSNTAVTWKALLGTITSAGMYTAPTKAGTDTVTATSVADPTKSGSANITISTSSPNPAVTSVTVSPASTSASLNGALQFTATVQGTASDKSVTWSASLGTINSSGAYTAPAKAGTDTVTATSNADASKSATAIVAIAGPAPNPSPSASCSGSNCPAFPGAQGGGAASAGGRGGVVFEVTNLNDSGSGSLRACIDASGPRTCVFRIGGVINVSGDLRVRNPFLTVAGQTAPGGGIKLTGTGAIMWVNTHDVIIRYLSYDGNSALNGPSVGSVSFDAGSGNAYNVVFDHVSGFHVTNKQLISLANDAGQVRDITFQWSMTYKPDAMHPVGPMTDATTWPANQVTNIDYHHNFFADTSHRLPLFNTKSGRWVNNIVYNWDWFGGLWQGGATPDIIGSKYVPGNMNVGDNGGHPHQFELTSTQSTDDVSNSMPGPPSAYLSGNIGVQQSNPAGDQTLLVGMVPGEGASEAGPAPASWFRTTPLPIQAYPITADPVANLDSVLLPTVGNSQQLTCDGTWNLRRQTEDNLMIVEYQNKTAGSLWTAPSGYTTSPVSSGTACTESLHDGIPDQWKTRYGLSTSDTGLAARQTPNGYTYLENYLNGTDPTK